MSTEQQFIVFKKSRAYYAGPGYQNYQPSSKEAAEAHAIELSAENPVGFEALPYVAPENSTQEAERQAFLSKLDQIDSQQ